MPRSLQISQLLIFLALFSLVLSSCITYMDTGNQMRPTNRDAVHFYNSNGLSCLEAEDYEQAVHYFTLAIELMPKDAYAYFYRCQAYSFMGEDENAGEDCGIAFELCPGCFP